MNNVNNPQGQQNPEEKALINEIKAVLKNRSNVQKFRSAFNTLLDNIDFLSDDAHIEHAMKGLEKTNVDDRVNKQLETATTKTMRNNAIEKAVGGDIKLPTREEIMAEVEKKMEDRKANLAKRKQDILAAATTEAKKRIAANSAVNRAA